MVIVQLLDNVLVAMNHGFQEDIAKS